MAKPDDVTWHQYLRGYAKLRWRTPQDEHRFHSISGSLQAIHALTCGNLFDKTGPKILLSQPTQRVAQQKGHCPFTFRLQCLITGRLSRSIPYERFVEFGILTEDAETGGPFPHEPLPIVDRFAPKREKLYIELRQVQPYYETPDAVPWHWRYDEYLQSEEWHEKRYRVLQRDKFRCRYIGKASGPGDPLQVHHLTYVRIGAEDMDDLITICRSHHRQIHGLASVMSVVKPPSLLSEATNGLQSRSP